MNAIETNAAWSTGSPNDWKVDRLKDCLDSIVGGDWGDEPGSDVDGRDLVVLRVADFEQGSVKTEDLTVRAIKQSKIPHRLVTPRSLLIEKSGGGEKQWVGRVVCPGELSFESICSNFIAKVELSRKYDARFFNYLFSTLYDGEANRPHVRQTTGIQNLAVEHYLNTKVSLPLLPEQQRIADYLDASCEAIDQAVETKQKQLDTLDALRKSIIQKAVTQGLDPNVPMKDSGIAAYRGVPTHWRKSKLRYQIQISNGKFASDRVVENGDIPIYGGNGVMGYTDEANAKAPFVVIGRVGAHCGNAHYVGEDAWVSDNAMLVTTMHNPEYMAELFTALDFNTQAATTAQPVITGTKIKNTYVYLPGPGEQEEIVLFVKSKRQELEAIRRNIHSQVTTLKAYRKSLTHECVTGKRRISEDDVAKVKSHV